MTVQPQANGPSVARPIVALPTLAERSRRLHLEHVARVLALPHGGRSYPGPGEDAPPDA